MKWLPTDEFYNPYSISFDFKITVEEERETIENLLSQIGFTITDDIVKDFASLTKVMNTFIRENCKAENTEFLKYVSDEGIAMGAIPPDILLAKYTAQYLLIAAAKFVAGIAIKAIINWVLDQKAKKKEKEDPQLINIIEKVLEKTRKDKGITKIVVTKIEKYVIELDDSEEN